MYSQSTYQLFARIFMLTITNDTNKASSFTKTVTGNNPSSTDKSLCNITQLEHAFIVFVLKKLSSIEHPLSASTIADYIGQLTGEDHSEKTILRTFFALVKRNAIPCRKASG